MSQAMEIHKGVQPVETMPLAPAASESAAILSVIERMAMNPEIDPDRIERFIALKERMDKEAAEKAFNSAITAAKADIKPIARRTKGHNGNYADLATIADAIDPVLSRHGLSYRHRMTQNSGPISVTCILSHDMGHREETTITAAADTSGSKNSIQAIGSTQTYLMRYTLIAALGLSTTKDDDGAMAGMGELLNLEQIEQLQTLLTETNSDVAKFCQVMKVESLAGIPAKRFAEAVAKLQAKKARAAQ